MGLHIAEIQFKEAIPSFQDISQQYRHQTCLNIELIAFIHLATSEFGELLQDSSKLLSFLQADAAAVSAIDEQYKIEIVPFISTGHYEEAAAIRDRKNQAKKHLNYIGSIDVIVDYGSFYPIQVSARGRVIEIEMYFNQHYAVASLIKTLVDLGGACRLGSKELSLPKSWQKLKRWEDYRWYNRPKK